MDGRETRYRGPLAARGVRVRPGLRLEAGHAAELLIITCAVYTMRNELPSAPLYALCIGPTLLVMAIGSQTAALVGPATADGLAHGTSILMVCLVLLAAVMAVIGPGKNRVPASLSEDELTGEPRHLRPAGIKHRRWRMAKGPDDAPAASEIGEGDGDSASNSNVVVSAPVPDAAASGAEIRQLIGEYLRDHGLSLREVEVAELLMRGNRVSAIASRLYISENTVRGHAKNIYRKLDVHNRQELIDLGERLERS